MAPLADDTALCDRLDDLFAPFNRSDRPGLVVGVAIDAKPVYRRGFGLANVEHAIANTPETRMRIGSVTKHFACVAALGLAEEGILDIDDGVGRYIPELDLRHGEPTLRQLMTHAAGVRCYIDLGAIADGPAVHPAPAALAAQLRQRAVNFPPGERMLYSNGGYALLSLAMERAAGQSFGSLLKQRLFDPLGMKNTFCAPSDMEIHCGLAGLYVPGEGGGYRRGVFVTEGLSGDGAVVSTIDDMLLWMPHLRNATLSGSTGRWRQALQPAALANGFQSQYGLGLIIDRHRGVEAIHHNGAVTGGSCQMFTVPGHALDIIIMTNGAEGTDGLAKRVIDTVLGEARLQPTPPPAATADYRGLLGRFHCARSGMVVGFTDMAGVLGLSILMNPPEPLEVQGQALVSAFVKNTIGHFTIETDRFDPGAPPPFIDIFDSGAPDRFIRLAEPPERTGDQAADLAAVFYSHDADAHARIVGEEAALKLSIRGPYGQSLWTLQALAEDLFACAFEPQTTPWTGVVAVQRRDGRICAFTLSTPRTRNLMFERLPDPRT